MATRKRKSANLLDNRTASVSISRNGLTIQIDSVPAVDSAQVAQALLDALRNLVEAGYDEMVLDAGGVHSGALGDVPDEDGVEEFRDLPTLSDRRVGFHTA